MSTHVEIARLNLRNLKAMKGKDRLTMLTAYDVVTAKCLDKAGVEILLVGDSLGNVVYGFDSTLPVTMEMILAHTAAVARGSERAFIVADLPFMSYQTSVPEALKNAGRCLAEAGANAVKIEGANAHILEVTRRLVETGIPVMGHIGLTPQSVNQMGGYYTHGKTESDAEILLRQAIELDRAGCFSIVIECVSASVAAEITSQVQALTIGIGSSNVCDGEVLVINDLLGFSPGKAPKFAKARMDLKSVVTDIAQKYVQETKSKEK